MTLFFFIINAPFWIGISSKTANNSIVTGLGGAIYVLSVGGFCFAWLATPDIDFQSFLLILFCPVIVNLPGILGELLMRLFGMGFRQVGVKKEAERIDKQRQKLIRQFARRKTQLEGLLVKPSGLFRELLTKWQLSQLKKIEEKMQLAIRKHRYFLSENIYNTSHEETLNVLISQVDKNQQELMSLSNELKAFIENYGKPVPAKHIRPYKIWAIYEEKGKVMWGEFDPENEKVFWKQYEGLVSELKQLSGTACYGQK